MRNTDVVGGIKYKFIQDIKYICSMSKATNAQVIFSQQDYIESDIFNIIKDYINTRVCLKVSTECARLLEVDGVCDISSPGEVMVRDTKYSHTVVTNFPYISTEKFSSMLKEYASKPNLNRVGALNTHF